MGGGGGVCGRLCVVAVVAACACVCARANTHAPTHTHGANVAVTTTPHGIALASGCCGSGYARDGMYTATATTGAAEAEVPTLTLLQCMKD